MIMELFWGFLAEIQLNYDKYSYLFILAIVTGYYCKIKIAFVISKAIKCWCCLTPKRFRRYFRLTEANPQYALIAVPPAFNLDQNKKESYPLQYFHQLADIGFNILYISGKKPAEKTQSTLSSQHPNIAIKYLEFDFAQVLPNSIEENINLPSEAHNSKLQDILFYLEKEKLKSSILINFLNYSSENSHPVFQYPSQSDADSAESHLLKSLNITENKLDLRISSSIGLQHIFLQDFSNFTANGHAKNEKDKAKCIPREKGEKCLIITMLNSKELDSRGYGKDEVNLEAVFRRAEHGFLLRQASMYSFEYAKYGGKCICVDDKQKKNVKDAVRKQLMSAV